jgi:hypothetical protein
MQNLGSALVELDRTLLRFLLLELRKALEILLLTQVVVDVGVLMCLYGRKDKLFRRALLGERLKCLVAASYAIEEFW